MTQDREPQVVHLDFASTRRIIVAVLLLATLLRVAEWVFGVTQSFLFILLLSWLISIALEPPVKALERRGLRRGAGTGLVLLLVLIGTGAFLSVFGGMFFGQLADAVLALPSVIDSTVAWANDTFNTTLSATSITDQLSLTPDKVASVATSVAGGVLGIVTSIVSFVFEMFTILVFAFYLSAEAPGVRRAVASWLRPDRQRIFLNVWDIAVAKTGGFVVSRIVLATLSAAAHTIAFWLIGVPYWMPLGLFAGVVSQFIPTVGTYVGIVVPVAFAAANEPIDCLWIIGFATIYQQIENYLLGPRISKATMDLHPAITLAAVFIGTAVFGPIGALIGIPIAAAVIAVIDTYGHRYEIDGDLEGRLFD